VLEAPWLWCVSFSASAPHELVAAFASSVAASGSVRHRTLSEGAADRLTVVHRS
jgi:hypothetical protein